MSTDSYRRYFVRQALRLLEELGVPVEEPGRFREHPRELLELVHRLSRDRRYSTEMRALLRAEGRLLAGRIETAVRELEPLAEEARDDDVRGLALDRLGDLLYREGRYEEAERRYREAIRLRPDDEALRVDLERVVWRRIGAAEPAAAKEAPDAAGVAEEPPPRTGSARVLPPAEVGAPAGPRRRGVVEVHGLYVGAGGAGLLRIQGRRRRDRGTCQVTGTLGQVATEACDLAWSLWEDRAEGSGVRIHLPQAAVPKDGPSLGLAVYVLVGAVLGHLPAPRDVAFTGELDLVGRVLRVGGIEEKVTAAYFTGLQGVVLPAANLAEVPQGLRRAIRVRGVHHVEELPALLGGDWP